MTARPFQACSLLCSARLFALIFFIFTLPQSAEAAIIINEIAWMGTSVSQNDEWIELYNSDTDALNLDGFTLTDGSSLTIALQGTVPANSFFLLERTDDDTVPGVSAGLIYTGALANDGRTLTLRRSDNSIEDQVAGGTDWQSIGGDNVTKQTPQLSPSGWITAAATPGAVNAISGSSIEEDEQDEEDEVEAVEEEGDGGGNRRVSIVPAARTPALSIGGDVTSGGGVTTHTGRPVTFSALPSGISPMLVKSVTYAWNFGDGMTGAGKEVVHSYAYPGTYLVVAHAHFALYVAEARAVVTVLPIDLVLQKSDEGALFIHNESLEEMDISGYRITDQGDVFEFPERSFILPKGTITLAPKILGRTSFTDHVSIVKGGTHIASLGDASDTTITYAPPGAPSGMSASGTTHPSAEVNESTLVDASSSAIAVGNQVALSSAPMTTPPPWVTYGGLAVVIMLGLGALYLKGTPS